MGNTSGVVESPSSQNKFEGFKFWNPLVIENYKVEKLSKIIISQQTEFEAILDEIFYIINILHLPSEFFPENKKNLKKENKSNFHTLHFYFQTLLLKILPQDITSIIEGYIVISINLNNLIFFIYLWKVYSGDSCPNDYQSITQFCFKQIHIFAKQEITISEFKSWIQLSLHPKDLLAVLHAFGYNESLFKVWSPNLYKHFIYVNENRLQESQERIMTIILGFILKEKEEANRVGFREFIVIFSNNLDIVRDEKKRRMFPLKNENIFWWIQPTELDHIALLRVALFQTNLKIIFIKSQAMTSGDTCVYLKLRNTE